MKSVVTTALRSPGKVRTFSAEASEIITLPSEPESPHARPRKMSRVAADLISKHSDVFSDEAVAAIENVPGFAEVNDFRNDLRSFAGMFILLTILFYFVLAWYYHEKLEWSWTNSFYVSSLLLMCTWFRSTQICV